MKARTARNIVDALRVIQVSSTPFKIEPRVHRLTQGSAKLALAVTILGLTIKLLTRYQHLHEGCGPPDNNDSVPISNNRCDVVEYFVGAYKYCIVPPVLALCDITIWVIDSWGTGMPWPFIHWAGWFVQGFYMGGGTVSRAFTLQWVAIRRTDVYSIDAGCEDQQ